ncbi:hypothetical protein EDC96DRAFT_504151 [Choanephora cucurbitarum]|uniref:Uncharacterized protein n=1 Tax=Choanephora cucurbitarum TaxID=101091 RepID=A0A1C7NB54_9FUNG|nr:hypothetical protein EDC96DRAFT_504151 [Choanephora cucurbitarum]OBZ86365.1 hypothetical protein A0J61_05577 [Choanephora cucurbitarum]
MQNTPKSVLFGWAGLAVGALGAYLVGKEYTLNRLREYTRENSVTSSKSHDTQDQPPLKEGELRRSVNRRL